MGSSASRPLRQPVTDVALSAQSLRATGASARRPAAWHPLSSRHRNDRRKFTLCAQTSVGSCHLRAAYHRIWDARQASASEP